MRTGLAALGVAIAVAACGGGGGTQGSRVPFSALVSFGDSLSDVGTYKVGTVAALGGGEFTVNGPGAQNWTEMIAADIGVAAPCPAQTGLLPNIPGLVGAPVVDHPECTNYAQGSARVSNVFAPHSFALQSPPFSQETIGLMAEPVSQQIATHLARHGFSGTELVTVMLGGNDLFMQLGGVQAAAGGGAAAVGAAAAAGWSAETQQAVAAGGAAAVQAAATAAVTGMAQAGAELAGLVKTQILGKGAKYVAVLNLGDASLAPGALALDAQTRGLMTQMIQAFNQQLATGLAGTPALLVDAYTQNQDDVAHPAQYGLTNVTTGACSATSAANPLQGYALTCTANSTVAGDVSRYFWADDSGHLTPYGYQLLAQYTSVQLAKAGWL